ncbi:MAG: ParA family protein [Thermodesulfobacteriota bacterium]|nr:ParA family protein [Thermodesulfobacteriota bacterium]
MRIVATANQKGGCGKTTTAINLSSSLAMKGQKVLLIDFDPQAHATMGLNIRPSDLKVTIYDVMKAGTNGFVRIDDIVIPVRENFDLAPSNASLSAIEQELSGVDGRESRLLCAIEAVRKAPDYIVIDCPPSIGHLCFNALRACNEVIIPIDLSLFSLRGVSKLMEIVILLKEKLGDDIETRALITMYDHRTRYARHVLEKVREEFGENVFETVIRYNIRLRETVDSGLPIGEYDKHSIGHKDYEDLADEVMRSGAADADHVLDTLNAAQSFLQKRDEACDTAQGAPRGHWSMSV